MPLCFTCPNGHEGEIALKSTVPVPDAHLFCPICGSPVDILEAGTPPVAPTGPAIPPPQETTAALPPNGLPPEGLTLPPQPGSAGVAPEVAAVPGYEIIAELGRGGMGVVYKARQVKLGRLVALKMILDGGLVRETDMRRFRAEAEILARLQHPNIVQIHEVGEYGGRPYFSLELCPRGSLEERLNGSPMPVREAARLVEILARTMQTVHEKGVIHRDLKPANVLLGEDGTPKVTDFGLARRLDIAGQTASGAVLGTPAYMAPEQAGGRGKDAGPAADVYALGAILYRLLTGRPPFEAATPLEIILRVVSEEVVPPSRWNPKVRRDLEAVCLKALRKAPGQRYATAGTLADDLRRFQAGEVPEAAKQGTMSWGRRHAASLAVGALYGVHVLGLLILLCFFPTALLFPVVLVVKSPGFFPMLAFLILGYTLFIRQLSQFLKRRLADEDASTLRGHRGKVHGLAFSPDGRYIASASADATVRLWEAVTGQPWATLKGHRGSVLTVAFSPDGHLVASGGMDGTVRFWDPATGKSEGTLPTDKRWVYGLAFSPDGRTLAVGKGDGSIRLWDMATRQQQVCLERPKMRASAVHALGYTADGQILVSWHEDGTATLWDLSERKERTWLRAVAMDVAANNFWPALALAPTNPLVALGSGKDPFRPISLWNSITGQFLGGLEIGPGLVRSVPQIALGFFRSLWPLLLGIPPTAVSMANPRVRALAFSKDGDLLAAAVNRELLTWDMKSRKLRHCFRGHSRAVLAVAISPDGQTLASGSADQTVRLWDLTTPPSTALAGLRGDNHGH